MEYVEVVSPFGDAAQDRGEYAPRPARLDSAAIGLLDNVKPNAARVLSLAFEELRPRLGLGVANLVRKQTATLPATASVIESLEGSSYAFVGVGD